MFLRGLPEAGSFGRPYAPPPKRNINFAHPKGLRPTHGCYQHVSSSRLVLQPEVHVFSGTDEFRSHLGAVDAQTAEIINEGKIFVIEVCPRPVACPLLPCRCRSHAARSLCVCTSRSLRAAGLPLAEGTLTTGRAVSLGVLVLHFHGVPLCAQTLSLSRASHSLPLPQLRARGIPQDSCCGTSSTWTATFRTVSASCCTSGREGVGQYVRFICVCLPFPKRCCLLLHASRSFQ